ncbi:predicted protein [Lichtheimia corymbifera JMRC:FSU:9682]|uniref:Uncharacterized protein n=1 Tax=Lichtheimia corymbifera JMRC:FSU:9682 TaxID=1263082 RepID=A0A068SEQ1_9FUNG|nr:predicted protein [Lichtheimia corymbifera JMRC:FSU:9682]
MEASDTAMEVLDKVIAQYSTADDLIDMWKGLGHSFVALYKEKLSRYSAMFIFTNVIGFIPAVISCELDEHAVAVFWLIITVICFSSLHMVFYYVTYQLARYTKAKSVLVSNRKTQGVQDAESLKAKLSSGLIGPQEAIHNTKIAFIQFNDLLKRQRKPKLWRLLNRWAYAEKAIQLIIACLSFAIIVLLLSPVSRFSDMDLMDIAQVLFTVWLYFVNIAMLVFRQPSQDLMDLYREVMALDDDEGAQNS